jgi:hypothetical protein
MNNVYVGLLTPPVIERDRIDIFLSRNPRVIIMLRITSIDWCQYRHRVFNTFP